MADVMVLQGIRQRYGGGDSPLVEVLHGIDLKLPEGACLKCFLPYHICSINADSKACHRRFLRIESPDPEPGLPHKLAGKIMQSDVN